MTSHPRYDRRAFLSAAAVAPLAARVGTRPAPAPAPAPAPRSTLDDNVYTRLLGVRPHLGAHDHISRLGGGRMAREVQAAMAEANEYFVDLHELLDAAGA